MNINELVEQYPNEELGLRLEKCIKKENIRYVKRK